MDATTTTNNNDKGTKPPCIVSNTGAFATAGARGNDKMEDRHKIFRDFNGLPHCAVMAVFDGHRGFECAEYCSENLSDAILSEWGENGNDIPLTLKKVFQKLHLAFVKHWTEKNAETCTNPPRIQNRKRNGIPAARRRCVSSGVTMCTSPTPEIVERF